jgi:hypothetical protein
MDGKIGQCVCIKFCVKLSESATQTPEMLQRGFWRTFFKLGSDFWMEFMFQGWSSVSWRWRTFRATKHQLNNRKCWQNSRNDPQRPLLNNPRVCRHCWEQVWSLQEILTEYLNTHCIATQFVPRLLTNDQKQRHVNVCLELQEKANKDPTFISRIMMGDESLIMVMIQEQSNNHHSGRAHNHQEQKRWGRSGVQQRAGSLFFFST